MADTPTPGAGDVDIVLGAHTVTLKCSVGAALSLGRAGGGIAAVLRKVLDLDLDAIVATIAAGTGKASKDLPDLVYAQGIDTVASQCVTWLYYLRNGGKPPQAMTEGQDEENPPQS